MLPDADLEKISRLGVGGGKGVHTRGDLDRPLAPGQLPPLDKSFLVNAALFFRPARNRKSINLQYIWRCVPRHRLTVPFTRVLHSVLAPQHREQGRL